MNSVEMAKIVRARARLLQDADTDPPTVEQLADDGELLNVLARVIEGKDLGRALGSPGDWGYNHPVGRALAASEACDRRVVTEN
jgi:hypothetical protein